MIKNKNIQILIQTVYCTLGVIGILASLGLFEAKWNQNFYVWYTNLSNYICIGFMFASLVHTVKEANRKKEEICSFAPRFKFMCVIMILVTFLVYNILLAKDSTVTEYFTSINNLTLHVILPLLFIADWILFYEHGKTKWYFPLISLIMPLIYVAVILIRGCFVDHQTELVYPYFFLDVDELGWNGFCLWLGILIVIFSIIGYLFVGFDHIGKIRNRKEKDPR